MGYTARHGHDGNAGTLNVAMGGGRKGEDELGQGVFSSPDRQRFYSGPCIRCKRFRNLQNFKHTIKTEIRSGAEGSTEGMFSLGMEHRHNIFPLHFSCYFPCLLCNNGRSNAFI